MQARDMPLIGQGIFSLPVGQLVRLPMAGAQTWRKTNECFTLHNGFQQGPRGALEASGYCSGDVSIFFLGFKTLGKNG